MLRALSVFFLCLSFGLSALTLEEKAGQILMVHFHGEIPNEEAKALIQETKVGGFIYYNWSNGLHAPEQVKNLSAGLQKLAQENKSSIPLFIGIDQEGGVVNRLKEGFTTFPGNRALGETRNPNLAEASAFCIGQELRSVGINMNFAPVVDVNINPRNPIIGSRAFGDDPEIVCAFGEKALKGYKRAHIIASLKHFPGHGDVEVDSHKDLPVIHKSMSELERVELFPFAKLAPAADLIMTAHLLVPALDKEKCSTLSKKTLSYLKNTIGFEGVIITDSLVMEGVLKKCRTVDEAAIQALEAGCDILLLGGKQLVGGGHTHLELSVEDIQRIHRSIVNAVKSGRISETRLNEAVRKVLSLKKRYLYSAPSPVLDREKHRELAQTIESLALRSKMVDLGERIWKNECAGTVEGLTDWNKGENFASLGIGHFIWYSVGYEDRFQETFPDLLRFLQKEGVILPDWLKEISKCPWSSREEFYENIKSSHMKSLRQLLFETRDLQAIFIAKKLEESFPQIIKNCSIEEKEKISTLFIQLSKDANGLYALLDYLNFKGSGTSPSESYKGQGWGLLQVLQGMPSSSKQPLVDFVASAKLILKLRVENSPPERQEERWLKGWFNRLDTYLAPL